MCKIANNGDLADCKDVDFGVYSPEKGFIGGGGSWITFIQQNQGVVTCGLDEDDGMIENDGCVISLELPNEGAMVSSLVVNDRADRAWVGLDNDEWFVCTITPEGVYIDCTEGSVLGKVYDVIVSPDGDNVYVITPDLTRVLYCEGSLREVCTPVAGLDTSGNVGHVLVSFESKDTVYVEEMDLTGETKYVTARCIVPEPAVFASCKAVRESTKGQYLDMVFANDGEHVYVASSTDDTKEIADARFFNPFAFLASLLTFRKPGPNVYVTQHVDICHAGYCNITLEDVMELTLSNISYEYPSKHRSFINLMEEENRGYEWHVCKKNALTGAYNLTDMCLPVDINDALAVTRPIHF